MRLSSTLALVALTGAGGITGPRRRCWKSGRRRAVGQSRRLPGTSLTLIDPDFRTRLLATRTDAGKSQRNHHQLRDAERRHVDRADENTYLVLPHNPGGPSVNFDYGRHFLFQGHENGSPKAYITRINLDVPRGDAHRITLLTPADAATGNTGTA